MTIRGIRLGAKFRYSISSNFKIEAGVAYLHKQDTRFSIRSNEFEAMSRGELVDFFEIGYSLITPHIIKASIGIHYRIPIRRWETQQAVQRQPRQRVAPHQRALPCPPGQMRHNRSWDRPPSVFNHPSGR